MFIFTHEFRPFIKKFRDEIRSPIRTKIPTCTRHSIRAITFGSNIGLMHAIQVGLESWFRRLQFRSGQNIVFILKLYMSFVFRSWILKSSFFIPELWKSLFLHMNFIKLLFSFLNFILFIYLCVYVVWQN